MKISTQKRIFPIAIKKYLVEKLNDNNYGNIENNLNVILKDLAIDDSLEAVWKINTLYFLDKRHISREENTCSDFKNFEPFNFSISAKKNANLEEYNIAIKKFNNSFMANYQNPFTLQAKEEKLKLKIPDSKRQNKIFILLLAFISIGVFLTILYLKYFR